MSQDEQIMVDDKLYFLTYAHTLTECLSDKTQIHTVKLLLEWLTEFSGSENPKTKEQLLISNDFVLNLEQRRRDVPKYLKDFAATSNEVKSGAKKHFEEVLKEVIPQRREDLYSRLWKLIRASDIAEVTVQGWKATYDSKDFALFFADVFLYALQVKAPLISKKTKKAATNAQMNNDVVSDINRLAELFARVGILTPIPKPQEIAPCEQAFISPLYCAYGSIDGKLYDKKQDLPTRLQMDVEIRRDHFYAAETVRIQGSNALGSIGTPQFKVLMDELFDAVYDVCFDEYQNGFVRMKKVMEHVASVPCSKSIFSKTNWVGAAEKQGVCHMLAGEKRLQWVVPNE